MAKPACFSLISYSRVALTVTSGHRSLKPTLFHRFPTSKPVTLGGLVIRRAVLGSCSAKFGDLPLNTMTEMVRSNAFRNRDGSEDELMETEVILGAGSSGVQGNLSCKSLEATLNQSSKWLLAVLFSIFIIWKHDAEAMWAAMGSVINSSLSLVLKNLLNQKRPGSAQRLDPGMPSSHAQSIFYIIVFAVLSLVHWLGINALSVTIGALFLAFGSYLSWLRVSQQLHTISQVIVGAALGATWSTMWFWSWHAIVLKAFIAFFWVRIAVIIGAAGFILGFLQHVIQHWL